MPPASTVDICFAAACGQIDVHACVGRQSHCRREYHLRMPPVDSVAPIFWQCKLGQVLVMCGRVSFIEQDSTSLWCLHRVRMLYVLDSSDSNSLRCLQGLQAPHVLVWIGGWFIRMRARVCFIEEDSVSLWCLHWNRMLYVLLWIMVRIMCTCGRVGFIA